MKVILRGMNYEKLRKNVLSRVHVTHFIVSFFQVVCDLFKLCTQCQCVELYVFLWKACGCILFYSTTNDGKHSIKLIKCV